MAPLAAQSKRAACAEAAGKPADYKSPHFLLHTDLSAAEAKELLSRLETMLGLVSTYWGKPPSGVIECYVVKDLANWTDHPADGARSWRGQREGRVARRWTSDGSVW